MRPTQLSTKLADGLKLAAVDEIRFERVKERLHVGVLPRRPTPRQAHQIWVGELTYLSVAGRWWYLAAVLDQYSRRLLAWRLGTVRDTRLTRAVVDAALRRRRPPAGLIFHTDRGSEFLSALLRDRLTVSGIRQRGPVARVRPV